MSTMKKVCVLCRIEHHFTGEPTLWGPCACGGAHFVCLYCVGKLVVDGFADASEVCPADPGLRVALALMGGDE